MSCCLLREKYGASTHAILVWMVLRGIISQALMKRAMESDGENHWSSRSDGEAYVGYREAAIVAKTGVSYCCRGVVSEQKGREMLGADGEILEQYGEVA